MTGQEVTHAYRRSASPDGRSQSLGPAPHRRRSTDDPDLGQAPADDPRGAHSRGYIPTGLQHAQYLPEAEVREELGARPLVRGDGFRAFPRERVPPARF